MLFNSIEFFLFLPVVFFLYWFVLHKNLSAQNLFILIASYIFYAWWEWKFLFLLLLSTLIGYIFGLSIPKSAHKKLLLWCSVIIKLAILGVFKYYNFFAASTKDFLELFGFNVSPYFLHIALPVGISFYTFHGMSYVYDVYREKIQPIKNIISYSVFVSFFPLLVAGPIERATHLLPQVLQKRQFNYKQSVEGVRLILWGLFKKVVIADSLAYVVDNVFQNYPQFSGSTLFLAVIYFSIQIYCDFSGYSDIALGTAKLFGFELLSNFRFPYFSRNIAEFWRRWHISLSTWFRDYLYIPLGGSKVGKLKAVRNTFIIFILSGFWHGANWTFIFWGGIHAMLFIPLLLSDNHTKYKKDVVAADSSLPSFREIIQMFTTFLIVALARIFFRSPDIETAFDYISHLSDGLLTIPQYHTLLPYVFILIVLDWMQRKNERNVLAMENRFLRYTIYFSLAVLIVFHFSYIDKKQFIYFHF